MTYRILVPVHSLDEHISELVNLADKLCKQPDSKLLLLHVLPDLEDINENETRELLDDARGMLESFSERLCCAADDIEIRLQMGNPEHEILKCSIIEQVDIIAMPTNGHTGINRLLLGSVAEHIIRRAHCPVVTTRKDGSGTTHAGSFERILLPLDGTEESMKVVPLIMDIARTHGSAITLFYDEYGLTEDQFKGEEHDMARQRIEAVATALRDTGLQVSTQTTRFKNPAEEISRIVDDLDIDLVAMTTHGRSGLSRLVFGSVAEEYLQHSHSPLLTLSTAKTASYQYEEQMLG